MKKTDWKGTAELIGIVAIVASLIFVGLQLRQDQKIAEAQAIVDAAAVVTELNQFVEDNREVWIQGLDGAELSPEDKFTFDTICRASYLRKISHYERARLLNAGDPELIAESFAYDIYIYAGLRGYFSEVIDNFEQQTGEFGRARNDGGFTTAVEESLANLDRNPPPPPKIRSYIIN